MSLEAKLGISAGIIAVFFCLGLFGYCYYGNHSKHGSHEMVKIVIDTEMVEETEGIKSINKIGSDNVRGTLIQCDLNEYSD